MVRPKADLPDVHTAQPEPVRVVTSVEEFRKCMQRNTPCVYTGIPLYSFQGELCEPWLREHVGQSKVCVRRSPTGKFIDPSDGVLNIAKSLAETNISLNEFLERNDSRMLLSGTDTYIYTKNAVVNQWSKLWAHASQVIDEHGGARSLIPQSALSTVGLWLSRDGVQSMTHYDDSLDHNLNFQIKGKKEILMFPPEDWKHLKTFKAMSMQPFSFFEGIKKGHTTSIQQQKCQPQKVELNEGDILFIPSGWFHFVEHVDDLNINLTYWYKTGLTTNEMKKPRQSLRNVLIPLKLSLAFLLSYFAS